jgi:hypothetical protein
VLSAFIPQSLRYLGQTEVEAVTTLFIALLAYTGLRLVERPGLVNGALFGLTAAAATLTKPVTQFYPLLFFAVAWLVWYLARRRQAAAPFRSMLAATLAALLCFSLPIAPWIMRNRALTDGAFSGISSNAPAEALRGYIAVKPEYVLLQKDFGAWDPEANDYEEAILAPYGVPFYRVNAPESGRVEIVPPMPAGVSSARLEAEKDRIEAAELSRMLFSQPVEFVKKVGIQLVTFWYLVVDRKQSLIVGVSALALLAMVVLGTRVGLRKGVPVWPVLAIAIYLNLVYASTLAMARYSMPLYPTLMVLAAAGVFSLVPLLAGAWPWRRKRSVAVDRV